MMMTILEYSKGTRALIKFLYEHQIAAGYIEILSKNICMYNKDISMRGNEFLS